MYSTRPHYMPRTPRETSRREMNKGNQMPQRPNRRAGVEDRWTKTIRDADGNLRSAPSATCRKGKRWRARYVDGNGGEVAKGFARKVDAQNWLDEVTSTIVTGTYVAPGAGNGTICELYKQWVGTFGHLKVTTKAARESAWITHVRDVWEAMPVCEVQTSAVRAWVNELASQGSSAPTIENALGVLRMILGLAVEDRRIASNPCNGVQSTAA